jgi:hypothetical protein
MWHSKGHSFPETGEGPTRYRVLGGGMAATEALVMTTSLVWLPTPSSRVNVYATVMGGRLRGEDKWREV